MQNVEWAMEGVDVAHRAEIHPRWSLVDAIDRGVPVYRVEVEARDILRFEDVADLVKASAFGAMVPPRMNSASHAARACRYA
jgi:hypothetical protein